MDLPQHNAHKVRVMSLIVADRPPVVNQKNHFAGHAAANQQPRPKLEVADIFRLYGADYRRSHAMTVGQAKVMRAIEVCRTAELGGHIEECDQCGLVRPVYNSCRNRHCPKCKKLATAEWLKARQDELLPVGYFHNVFTMPHELNPLAAANPGLLYGQLFRSVAATLMGFAADPQHGLGGLPGFTAVLHTWDQQLQYHVHLHCIIAAGALVGEGEGRADSRWVGTQHLFGVRALSRAYRDHVLAALRRLHGRDKLVLPGRLAEPGRFLEMIELLAARHWVCFSRAPFATTDRVLEYLSRYTNRIAISNQRLLDIGGGQVTFHYRDRKDGNRVKERTIAAAEFIGRFLQHVMPKGLPRMRHYGFLSNRRKARCLARCRELLGQKAPAAEELSTNRVELLLQLKGVDLLRCPACGEGRMEVVEQLRPRRVGTGGKVVPAAGRAAVVGKDTS